MGIIAQATDLLQRSSSASLGVNLAWAVLLRICATLLAYLFRGRTHFVGTLIASWIIAREPLNLANLLWFIFNFSVSSPVARLYGPSLAVLGHAITLYAEGAPDDLYIITAENAGLQLVFYWLCVPVFHRLVFLVESLLFLRLLPGACLWCFLVGPVLVNGYGSVTSIRRVSSEIATGSKLSMSHCLQCILPFEATRPCDRIYAMRGMAADRGRFPAPDYTISDEQAFLRTAKALLRTEDWPDALHFAGRGYQAFDAAEKPLSLPSWVPKWRGKLLHGLRQSDMVRTVEAISSDGRPVFEGENDNDAETSIRVQALRLDTLGPLVPGIGPAGMVHQLDSPTVMPKVPRLHDWYRRSRYLARKYAIVATPHGGTNHIEAVDDAFWHALIYKAERANDPEYRTQARCTVEKFFFADKVELLERQDPLLWQDLDEHLRFQVETTLQGTAFSVTSAGRMALVPLLSKTTDDVFYIRGTAMPFVLRQIENGSYELMGSCYVHGVPDIPGDVEWTEITLQ